MPTRPPCNRLGSDSAPGASSLLRTISVALRATVFGAVAAAASLVHSTSAEPAATPVPPSYVSQIGFSRYTDLGESMYSQEYGLLGPTGFIPAGYIQHAYSTITGPSRADVLPISGKIVVTKATWTEWLAFDSTFTAKFSTSSPSTLDHVPVLVAQWAGGTGVPTPVPPSYVSQIGFSRYTDLSESMYSQEYGLLGPSGFIPAGYWKRTYSTITGPSRAEILPVSGTIVVTKATWTEWLAFGSAFTAKFSTSSPSTLDHVPVLVAQWAAGTELSCPDSVAISFSGNTAVLKFASVSGSFYDVQYCTDLGAGNWVVVASNLPGTGAQLIVNDPSAGTATRRFYRVLVHL